jgi:hypothetical protein
VNENEITTNENGEIITELDTITATSRFLMGALPKVGSRIIAGTTQAAIDLSDDDGVKLAGKNIAKIGKGLFGAGKKAAVATGSGLGKVASKVGSDENKDRARNAGINLRNRIVNNGLVSVTVNKVNKAATELKNEIDSCKVIVEQKDPDYAPCGDECHGAPEVHGSCDCTFAEETNKAILTEEWVKITEAVVGSDSWEQNDNDVLVPVCVHCINEACPNNKIGNVYDDDGTHWTRVKCNDYEG